MGAVSCGCVLCGRVLLVRAEEDGAGLAPCVCCLQLVCVSDVGEMPTACRKKWRVAAGESDPWLSHRRVRGQSAGRMCAVLSAWACGGEARG